MNNKNYMFDINWEDRNNNKWQVGYLGQIEKDYYLLIKNKDRAVKAYESGFIGIPGFIAGIVYKSTELFDFFKDRVLDKKSEEPFIELAQTKGVSNIDSFSLEEVPKEFILKKQEELESIYRMQKELSLMRKKQNELAINKINKVARKDGRREKNKKGSRTNKVEHVHG